MLDKVATCTLGIIGAGNMGSAIVKGIISKKVLKPEQIYIYDIDSEKEAKLVQQTGVNPATSNKEVIENSSIIVLAIKPDVYPKLLEEVKTYLKSYHILISIAAGVPVQFIKEQIEERCKVVRTMPNTPALIGEGMIALCNNHELNQSELKIVKQILSSLGRIEEVDEKLIDAVTAISGSSPAYVYVFIEAIADGGVLMGLPRDQAYRMAAQAVLGAARMVLEAGKHPAQLKDMVCSPAGTTIEAISVLEKNGFRGSVIEAVRRCAEKSKKMGRKVFEK